MEPALYPTLVRCPRKIILAGDPHQLPPTVLSQDPTLSYTLLQELMKKIPTNVVMLKIQYRMNQLISDWISSSMYNGELCAAESVKNHTLRDLPNVSCEPFGFIDDVIANPINLVDTAGEYMNEASEDSDDSKSNPGEATIVAILIDRLRKKGVNSNQIAIISPYSAQVQLLSSVLPNEYSCRSVDGYQGGEAEVVIISLVRSNDDGSCGFLSDKRRLNVAVSRARRCCIVVADSQTVTQLPFIEQLVTYFCDKGNIITPSQLETEEDWAY